jgi:predicted helicase
MTATIHTVLDDLRQRATSERDKGALFEDLIAKFLRTDPIYAAQYTKVWGWMEYPDRDGKVDTGIDLVAEEAGTGDHVAIQCKFYADSHYLQKSDIDSFFTALGKKQFSAGLIVSTTDKWSKHAEDALADQTKPVGRLRVGDLDLSPVDWAQFSFIDVEYMPLRDRKHVRPHQREAIDAVREGLASLDRGKLIMACGTGKTFTSLRLVEEQVEPGGTVLFLVPSISLLSQTLREWSAEAAEPMRYFAVCSDRSVGKGSEDIRVHDLAIPATTNTEHLVAELERGRIPGQTTVVFSTYQSIDVVSRAQKEGIGQFDLVICDEAHRTTGVTVAGEDDSAFVKVHDNRVIDAAKRVYMTATPRLYDDVAKAKAAEGSALLASMDDESLYGPELHRLGFGEAVERDLLADYKVLVLAVDEEYIAREFQRQLADENLELKLDDVAKIVGCYNGLEKRALDSERLEVDSNPMRRAVAFSRSIKDSKSIAEAFDEITDHLAINSKSDSPLRCSAKHVDGTFNVLERNEKLDWLKEQTPAGQNICRILSNARCLSEGVDVPSLDAVLFLNPRNSVVDVVQSVGRVMRKAPGKTHGYVILPIGVPAGVEPEQALNDNKKYKVVWQVLQALRAHDDRFDAMVNKLELNKAKDDKLQIIGVGGGDPDQDGDSTGSAQQLSWSFSNFEQWQDALYAKIVQKVGDRRYWEDWAKDIAVIADRHVTRIKAILADPTLDVLPFFEKFHAGLRANLNDGITRDNAIEMLAQHLITKPVFDALFEGYDFAANNPVSVVMQDMLEILDEQGIESEVETLEKFYASVRLRASGIDNAEGKQKIVTELYENFFKNAFPKAAASLGIVYTPIEIVDFILRSVDHLLRTELDSSLDDEGVHVLDPFTGTGTFVVRLLQSGLITPEHLLRKYTEELHANEINLLAYYVAAVNIEATFHGIVGGDYKPFEGIVLTDTFQMHEADDTLDESIFVNNTDRVVRQKTTDIRVIIGNPPYSAKQDSANDVNANLRYPTLDKRIESTYGAASAAKNKNSLYDSYIRAIRWAADRVGDRGIVGFVTNGGFLTSKTADGIRRSLVDEFDRIYIWNLRGNQRASDWRAEGGKVFGGGSQSTIAITFLVKTGEAVEGRVKYVQMPDGATREDKLEGVGSAQLKALDWVILEPDKHGDWFDKRDGRFSTFLPLTGKGGLLPTSSNGLGTSRDAWVYNFDRARLDENVRTTIRTFNRLLTVRENSGDLLAADLDATTIKWSSSFANRFDRGQSLGDDGTVVEASYRPFCKQWVYLSPTLNHRPGIMLKSFGRPTQPNHGIYLTGAGTTKPFSALMVAAVPDLNFWGSEGGQFIPRRTFEGTTGQFQQEGDSLAVENVSAGLLNELRSRTGIQLSADDAFYYAYGLLHSTEFRGTFAADLGKALPRIPVVRNAVEFADAGRELAKLHLDYEALEPFDLDEIVRGGGASDLYRVQKMAFAKVDGEKDRSQIVFNSNLTLAGIPDGAYRYMLGSRSAIEWIMERYQMKIDKASGIVNDPNDWASEHNEPRYIIDLLKRIVTVSVETMKIVDDLPQLDIIENSGGARL